MPTPRGIPLAPLTGVLDLRSSPDELQPSSLRMRQNFKTLAAGKLRRGTGWTKLLDSTSYNNEDLHDQLLAITQSQLRQPVTLLFEAESTLKVRSLFAATQGAVTQLDEWSGNWRVIGSGYGGTAAAGASARRFKAAQLGDYLVLTNDWDKPMYYQLESPSIDSAPLLQTFNDLDTIGLTRAKVVWVWKNCLFFADCELDSVRQSHRLFWSGFLSPLSFDPANQASITGDRELYPDERILGFRDFGNTGLLYTTRRIWEVSAVGGAESFGFTVKYDGNKNKGIGLLKYPNTLIALPDKHVYVAEDGVYSMTPFQIKPERMEWLHRSSPAIMDDIDAINCDVHIAWASKDEFFISTASASAVNNCPDRTLRANITYEVVDVLDAGFTAACNYQSFKVPSIRDFIISEGICTLAELQTAGYGYENEGLPKPLPIGPDTSPDCIYTTVLQTIDLGHSETLEIEDWNQPTASANSLCTQLGDLTLDDLCRKCEGNSLMVAALSTDLCLKELTDVFYKERCANPSSAGSTTSDGYVSAIGSYLLDGIVGILRFAPAFMPREYIGRPLVNAKTFILDAIAQAQTPATKIKLRIGISGQVIDPNDDGGKIKWIEFSDKELKWLSNRTGAQHVTAGTTPETLQRWNFEVQGRVLYFELSIEGTGGDAEFTGVASEVTAVAAVNY